LPRPLAPLHDGDRRTTRRGSTISATACSIWTPEFTLPETGMTRLTLSTFGGPLPVFVERRACQAFGTVLDFTVEIGVQTSQGMQPMIGCCREAP
jgi:hypothetical protein